MANAASLLAELLISWQIPPGNHYARVRGLSSDPVWDDSALAAQYLTEISRCLDLMDLGGRRTSIYRPLIPQCYASVFGINPDWGTLRPKGGPALASDSLALLQALGDLIDAYQVVEPVGSEQRQMLITQFAALLTALAGAEYLSKEGRAYLIGLLQQAISAIVLESTSDQRVRELAFELSGAFTAAASDPNVPTDQQPWWREQATTIVNTLVTGGATHAVTLAAGAALGALTGS